MKCASCSADFPSRNALFRHLRASGCGAAFAPTRDRRFVVLFGYCGTGLFGSQLNADEARYPTAEGVLCAAVQKSILKKSTRRKRGIPPSNTDMETETLTESEAADEHGNAHTNTSGTASGKSILAVAKGSGGAETAGEGSGVTGGVEGSSSSSSSSFAATNQPSIIITIITISTIIITINNNNNYNIRAMQASRPATPRCRHGGLLGRRGPWFFLDFH